MHWTEKNSNDWTWLIDIFEIGICHLASPDTGNATKYYFNI